MQAICLDPNLKIEVNRNDDFERKKSKAESYVMQNEMLANNNNNNLSDAQENIVTQQEAAFFRNLNGMSLNQKFTLKGVEKFICLQLENEPLVVVEVLSENQFLLSLKIVYYFLK